MNSTFSHWYAANQRSLMAAIAQVRQRLEDKIANSDTMSAQPTESNPQPSEGFAIDQLCAIFGLSPFERELLLLCAGMELDAVFASLCGTAQGDMQRAYPTFSLSLAALSDPHWDAIAPKSPLRRWQLIDVGAGKALTLSPLRIDERILHYLTGIQHLDERLAGIVKAAKPREALVPSHQQLADQITRLWSSKLRQPNLPIVQLYGDETVGKQAIAAAACTELGLNLHVLSPAALPTNPGELNALMRLWEREAILSHSALLIDMDELDGSDSVREGAIARLIEDLNSPILLSSRDRRRSKQRPLVTLEVRQPTSSEQALLWHHSLDSVVPDLNGHVDRLSAQFNLSSLAIRTVCAAAIGQAEGIGDRGQGIAFNSSLLPPPSSLQSTLWDLCRAQARPRLDDLAQRIESGSTWDDLVLPEAQKQILREVAAHVRQRAKVYESWGFADKGGRGLGISALFAGASGTGKTMAADVLAQELRLDLYRIDLSSVVSKYIGETEKNLRRVFDAAEAGGVILLFDEADALFGKRSEVKDSHDRYANMEVSYLLQRMESYRGLAILTTNLKDALDVAFLRRLRFVVKFPFPDVEQRAEIWRRVFPPQTPTVGLDVKKLARLNVAGGNIRNIALNAAFLAAEAGEPVQMQHLLRAAHSEYAKLERSLTEAEIKGWL